MTAPFTPPLPPLGIIEGYFGPPWSWRERTHVMRTLAGHGYSRFTYAPKADRKLRADWQQAHAADEAANIARFAEACREEGVQFGIGLSPFELHLDFGSEGRRTLRRRVEELATLGIGELAILFDDMRGDLPELAAIQADIVGEAMAATDAALTVCPTYYSDDPALDRQFGQRPAGYLADLGKRLPEKVAVYWTGPEVCAAEITPGHLDEVSERLGRAPVLWDNYPVNDGPRMSRRLHLKGFTGRRGLGGKVAAHMVNPALQPHLSLLPAATLPLCYRQGEDYDYRRAAEEAAHSLYPADLADNILETIVPLQDGGIGFIDPEVVRRRYGPFDHPAAREIIRFAEGGYLQKPGDVLT